MSDKRWHENIPKNTRPFEVGDIVIGHTIYRPEKTLIGEIVGIEKERPVIHVEEGDGYYIEDFVIKCIRKPRKGGKEARDIVAKLCLMYLNHKIYTKKNYQDVYKYWNYFNKEHSSMYHDYHEVPNKDFFSKKEEGVLAKLLALQKCYEKAKSMLSVDYSQFED